MGNLFHFPQLFFIARGLYVLLHSSTLLAYLRELFTSTHLYLFRRARTTILNRENLQLTSCLSLLKKK